MEGGRPRERESIRTLAGSSATADSTLVRSRYASILGIKLSRLPQRSPDAVISDTLRAQQRGQAAGTHVARSVVASAAMIRDCMPS